MLSQLQNIKAIQSAPALAAIVYQSRSVLPSAAGVSNHRSARGTSRYLGGCPT